MITNSDIKKLTAVFATKIEFNELKADVVQLKADVVKLKVDVAKLKDLIHEVIFELRDMREEFIAITYRNRDHTDKIESHEVRITKIEEKYST